MIAFYPPVLESKFRAIPFLSIPKDTDFFDIEFTMPSMNVLEDIGHIQVALKYQSTNENAVNRKYSPDSEVIYIQRDEGELYFYRKTNGNYVIRVPYKCFDTGRPREGVTYTVQVRFGLNKLWDPATNGIDNVGNTFGGFAGWRNIQTSSVPSGFGEWSNLATVYCYGAATETLEYNLDDFVPELKYFYSPVQDDPLEQCKVIYFYGDMYGEHVESMVFNGQFQQDGSYVMTAKIPLAPVQTIQVSVEAVTKNNTLRGRTITIFPLKYTPEKLKSLNGKMTNAELVGEENNDGVIAKTISVPQANIQPLSTMNLYRANIYTLETIKVVENIPFSGASEITVKDFSVEMGEEYQYIALLLDHDGKAYGTAIDVYDWGYTNPGYGRLMNMDSIVFLTTRDHQLRLQGAVNVSAFKRNTQDSFQNTIGSEFPFHSRSTRTNYRSFTLNGLISMAFDPTGSFLKNDYQNGLWWKNGNGEKLVILNRDLYGETQHSLSRRRVMEKNNHFDESLAQVGVEDKHDIFGPTSIYDDYFFRNTRVRNFEEKTNEAIYLERKFRDFVMEWLSDGKPKLFRSETEGNMIVMISNASFSPQERTGRMTYSVSMTVTEIAKYDLENLITYNLIPYDITTSLISGFPIRLDIGDIISDQDYLSIIFYEPRLAYNEKNFAFRKSGVNWEVIDGGEEFNFGPEKIKPIQVLNDILSKITEYSHIRGDLDYNLVDNFVYQYNKIYDIPDSVSGQTIKPIDTSTAVKGLKATYKNNENDPESSTLYPKCIYSIASGKLPENLTLDSKTGIISGDIYWPYDEPRQKDTVTLEVKVGLYSSPNPPEAESPVRFLTNTKNNKMTINVGYMYKQLTFSLPRHEDGNGNMLVSIGIPNMIVGEQIKEIDISKYVSGGVKFSYLPEMEGKSTVDYLYSAEGLPPGLYIDEFGMIRGCYLNETGPGFATIKVTDAVGNIVMDQIPYGTSSKPLYFQDSVDFNIGYSEMNYPITPIDVSGAVSGGYPKKQDGYVYGYSFSARGLPPGITIDKKTGIISGTPTSIVPAGKAILTAKDFSEPPAESSIEIIYQRVLEEFKFIYDKTFDIMPNNGKGMNLGLTIAPINLMEEGKEAVSGGLKYNDKPYYRFYSENLIPDFTIDNNGIISGRASVACKGGRQARLFVEDARGVRREMSALIDGKLQPKTLTIEPIISKLMFQPKEEITIPSSYVSAPDVYMYDIPLAWITGGTTGVEIKDENGTLKGTYPYGLRIDGLPPGYTADYYQDSSKLWYFRIVGKPTAENPQCEAILSIWDASPQKEQVRYKIKCGEMYGTFVWNQPNTIDNTIMLNGYQDGERIEGMIPFEGFAGGKWPYSIKILEGAEVFAPLEIVQPEEAEEIDLNGNCGIRGTVLKSSKPSFQVVITDNMGQVCTGMIQIGEVADKFSVKAINSMNDITLICGKSTINDFKIFEATGGTPPYHYYMSTEKGQKTFHPDIVIDNDTGMLKTIRPLSTPQLTANWNNMSNMWVEDSSNPPRKVYPLEAWNTPNIVKEPKLTNKVVNGRFTIPLLSYGQNYHSDALIDAALMPNMVWGVEDASKLPPGIIWSGGAFYGVVTGGAQKDKTTASLRVPEYNPKTGIHTPEIIISFGVDIEGTQNTLLLLKPENIDYDFISKDVAITEKNVAAGLSGGNAPYKWELTGAPAGITLSTAQTSTATDVVLIRGATSIEQTSTFEMIVKVTDKEGQSASYSIFCGGVFQGITFIDDPKLDIPPKKANEDITPIDLTPQVSGGTGKYQFIAENLSPYQLNIDTGIITGNSQDKSQPTKNAKITVRDKANTKVSASITISVGEITGKLTYVHDTSRDIPAEGVTPGKQGTVNIAAGVMGGTQMKYSIVSYPAGWTSANAKFTSENQGILTYVLPASGTEAGELEIKIIDVPTSDEAIAKIQTPKIP